MTTLGREQLREIPRWHPRGRPGAPLVAAASTAGPVVSWSAAIGVTTLVLRLLWAASGPTDWDSVQYLVGSGHFDVTHGAPQPPGYWLYVAVGHALHVVTGLSATTSLVLLAALASAGAAAASCAAGWAVAGRWTGVATGLFVATAPVSWFNGSIVATYSFDALVGALLVVLAKRARPGSWHAPAAVVVYGIGAGFRPTVLELFLPLVLIPVFAGVHSVRSAALVVGAGVASVALWFVPMVLVQPGGIHAWLRATRVETAGAARATSIFSSGSGGGTNLGTLAAYALLTLGLLAALGVVALLLLGLARLVTGEWAGDVTRRIWRIRRPGGTPWYQHNGAVLAAAIVPPAAIVGLVQFAKGGYLLAFLPATVIVLLLPLARLAHHQRSGVRRAALVLATAAVLGVCALNVQRFTDAPGLLPLSYGKAHPGVWISQARYQAPYAVTAQAITAADAADRALPALAGRIDDANDVVAVLDAGPGLNLYRNIGFALPGARVSLVSLAPALVRYTEQDGLLYYDSGATVDVGPGGVAWFLSAPPAPDLTPDLGTYVGTVAGFRVWRVLPGTSVGPISVVETSLPRPLGGQIR
ncbi:MAG: hypothetical protein ACYDA2_11170 [Acidimicrobiales bacterium]